MRKFVERAFPAFSRVRQDVSRVRNSARTARRRVRTYGPHSTTGSALAPIVADANATIASDCVALRAFPFAASTGVTSREQANETIAFAITTLTRTGLHATRGRASATNPLDVLAR